MVNGNATAIAQGALHVIWHYTQVAMICFMFPLADQAPHARTAVIPFFIRETGGPLMEL